MERYTADLLLTCSDEHPQPIPGGAVDVEGGRVVWAGPADQAPPRPEAPVTRIDGILMPGMIDIHCHTPMVLLRGAGEGLPVERWLREVMWPREAKLTPEDVRTGMTAGAAELLANGITTSVEMYFHGDAVARGADDAGLRCLVTAPVIEDEALPRLGSWEEQLEAAAAAVDEWASNPRIEVGIGPHAAYSVSERCLRRIADLARDTGMLVHIHVNEEEWEDGAVRERTGRAATEYLESIGLQAARVLAAHAVWMTDRDIEVFARNRVAVAHCPCSNTKHGAGIARVDDMAAAGLRLGIATDGPASHHRLDLFEEMRTAVRLSRVHRRDAQGFPPERALRMVTAEAADAVDRPDLGRLEEGAWADMLALDAGYPPFHPAAPGGGDPFSRIVWSGSPAAVRTVWVAGRKVVEDGAVTTVDRAALLSEMDQRAQRLAE